MHIYIKDRPNSIHTEEITFDGSDLVYLRDDKKLDRIAVAAVACVISDERQKRIDDEEDLDLVMLYSYDETSHYRCEG